MNERQAPVGAEVEPALTPEFDRSRALDRGRRIGLALARRKVNDGLGELVRVAGAFGSA